MLPSHQSNPGFSGFVSPTQRSRAAMDALAGMLLYSASVMRPAARKAFKENHEVQALESQWPPKDALAVAELVDQSKAIVAKDPLYRMERFVQRHVAEEMMARNVVMAEERRADHERIMALPKQGAGGKLELDSSLPVPPYYEDVFYHLAPHGGHEYDLGARGGGIGTVFKYGGFAAVPVNSNIGDQRVLTAKQLPDKPYGRILEMGCGGAFTLSAVHKVFPQAELIGCDLAAAYLEHGHETAEKTGLKVHFKQKDARATGEADASVDAVVTYALHHEAPVAVNIEIFKEMFRVLAPGGEVVINDPPPFRAVGLFEAVILEWDNDNREEPYFRETCLANWDEELKKIGFENVRSYSLTPAGYPWITRATKPM